MAASCVWDDLVGQTRAVSFLRAAAEGGTVAHAYLFVGPRGVGKKTAALALACAMFCDDGGCGSCRACRRVREEVHPDLHLLEPEGVADYLIVQVRDLIRDVHLKPIEAAHKLYVLEAVERLDGEAANALLKTLEEPPADVVIVLIADDYDDVMPTIASRCQVVRFSPIPTSAAIGLVVERTGADEREARAALAAAGGVIPRAIDFLRSPGRLGARSAILGVLKNLAVMDGHDVLVAARGLLADVRAPLDELKSTQSDELAEAREYLSKGGLSDVEKRHKRQLTVREREGLGEILNVTESWLRDCLVMGRGAVELVQNADAADATAEVAAVMNARAALAALETVGDARRRIGYNVSPQLAVEAMLFDIQEVLRCPR